MKQLLDITSEIILFSFLVIFPFSYGHVTNRWIILFIPAVLALIGFHFLRRKRHFNVNISGIIYVVLFTFLFDFAEQVNFIHQFNIPVEVSKRIPLSTILLSIGILVLLIKTIIQGKIMSINHPFVRYFLFAFIFIVVLMILFYPFIDYHYQMKSDVDIQLLNKLFKYLMISFLVMDYLSNENKIRTINLGVILSVSLTVILSIFL